MKRTRTVIALLLQALMLLSLCACGNGSNNEGGKSECGKSEGGVSASNPVELCKSDEEYLKEQGYTTFIYSSYLDSYASKLGVEVDALVRVTNAYNDNGDSMLIYYFKTADQAKTCYEKDTSAYKLAGLRVVYGDPQNLI